MAALLQDRKLATTPRHTSAGERPMTWVSLHGNATQLDYAVLPEELAAHSDTIGVPPGFVDHNGLDHRILAAEVSWQAEARPGQQRVLFDTASMRTEAGQATLHNIFLSAPSVCWEVHPDTHLQQLNDFLFTALGQSPCVPVYTLRIFSMRGKPCTDNCLCQIHPGRIRAGYFVCAWPKPD